MSGLFKGSQMNWACLTKEAYAIYMSIKKLAYYLEDADVMLRSDHLPLKEIFSQKYFKFQSQQLGYRKFPHFGLRLSILKVLRTH